jgi:protein SCO1
MKAAISNPWTFIALAFILPLTVYSLMRLYSAFYEMPSTYGTVRKTAFHGFSNQYNAPAGNIETGKITVVNFFFTSCPVICTKMMNNMKLVHDRFADDAAIKFVSVTVDPERDNHERLQWYIKKMQIDDEGWQLITGNKSKTYLLARNDFKLVAADANANSDFIHSDKLVLLDASGNIRGYYSGLEKSAIDQLIIDIKKLKN